MGMHEDALMSSPLPPAPATPGWEIRYQDVVEDDDLIRHVLDAWGFVVVRGVALRAECDQWGAGVRSFFGSLSTGVVLSDEDVAVNWPGKRWLVNSGGICHNFGVGHLPEVWQARQHPHVLCVFASVWQTSELVVSFDGVNAERPKTASPQQPPTDTLHTDQSPWSNQDARVCVQGVLSLTSTREHTGGTTVVAKSHVQHRRLLVDTFKVPEKEWKKDWISLEAPMHVWLLDQPGCQVLKLATDPGDLVLWDSRTMHCGRKTPDVHTHGWRLAVYICMCPAAWLDDDARARKAGALAAARTTSHWPDAREVMNHRPHFQGGKVPAGYRDGAGVTEPPALDKRGLQLAGVLPY
ncbi:hypothetical protein FOA52_005945 [Chlamydomonas sp. UWO 241]|nr:hypothetical protein FOA52_005945 [Chlamydomonas sp. UWO 241]